MSDNTTTTAPQAVVVFERTYRAPVETLWALWASKDGFDPGGGRRASASRSRSWSRARAGRCNTT